MKYLMTALVSASVSSALLGIRVVRTEEIRVIFEAEDDAAAQVQAAQRAMAGGIEPEIVKLFKIEELEMSVAGMVA